MGEAELVHLMIGRPIAEYFPRHADVAASEELLRVEHLSSAERFDDVSFFARLRAKMGWGGLADRDK